MVEKFERKIQEQYLAVQLAKTKSRDWVMENYLNTINLGQNTLGVQAAARRYFGKDVSELTISESAVIAAITQSPVSYTHLGSLYRCLCRNRSKVGCSCRQRCIRYKRTSADDNCTGQTTSCYFYLSPNRISIHENLPISSDIHLLQICYIYYMIHYNKAPPSCQLPIFTKMLQSSAMQKK